MKRWVNRSWTTTISLFNLNQNHYNHGRTTKAGPWEIQYIKKTHSVVVVILLWWFCSFQWSFCSFSIFMLISFETVCLEWDHNPNTPLSLNHLHLFVFAFPTLSRLSPILQPLPGLVAATDHEWSLLQTEISGLFLGFVSVKCNRMETEWTFCWFVSGTSAAESFTAKLLVSKQEDQPEEWLSWTWSSR